MIWVLYVMFMTEDRTLNSITEQKTFSSYNECNLFYTQNKKSLNESIVEIIQPRLTKSEIIHVGCMPIRKEQIQ